MRHAGGDSTFGFTKSGPTVHPETSAAAVSAAAKRRRSRRAAPRDRPAPGGAASGASVGGCFTLVILLRCWCGRRALRRESLRYRLEQEEEQRREDNGDDYRPQGAAYPPGADRAQTVRPRATRDRERYAPETEGERGHDDCAQPRPRGGERGLARGHAFAYVLDRHPPAGMCFFPRQTHES